MAITAATFQGYERVGPSAYRVRALLTDATKSPTTYEVWLEDITGDTLGQLTQSAAAKIAALSGAESRKDLLAGITVGTSIPIAPTAASGPTAGEIADATWVGNARLLVRVKALVAAGLSGGTSTTDVTNLTTVVNNGYTTARALKL